MPDAYLWLDPPWLNLGFSLALTVCESWVIFFVSSWSVNFIRVFSVVVRCFGWMASMRAGRFLCFGGGGVWGEGLVPVECILAPRWLGLPSVLGRTFCCC